MIFRRVCGPVSSATGAVAGRSPWPLPRWRGRRGGGPCVEGPGHPRAPPAASVGGRPMASHASARTHRHRGRGAVRPVRDSWTRAGARTFQNREHESQGCETMPMEHLDPSRAGRGGKIGSSTGRLARAASCPAVRPPRQLQMASCNVGSPSPAPNVGVVHCGCIGGSVFGLAGPTPGRGRPRRGSGG